MNDYERFEKEFGDYVNYAMNSEEVLDNFYRAFNEDEEYEEILLMENPGALEQDLFEYFREREGFSDPGLTDVIADLLPFYTVNESEDHYPVFMEGFELAETEEEMIYRGIYSPD